MSWMSPAEHEAVLFLEVTWLHFKFVCCSWGKHSHNKINWNFMLKADKQHSGFTHVDILEMHVFFCSTGTFAYGSYMPVCVRMSACVRVPMCLSMCMSDALSAGQRTLWLIPVCWLYWGLAGPPLRSALRRLQHQTHTPTSETEDLIFLLLLVLIKHTDKRTHTQVIAAVVYVVYETHVLKSS